MCSYLEHGQLQVRTSAAQRQVGSSDGFVLGLSRTSSSRREDDLHLRWHRKGYSKFMPHVQREQRMSNAQVLKC